MTTSIPSNDYRLRRVIINDVCIDWTQTHTTVTLNIKVAAWTHKRHIKVTFKSNFIDVSILNQQQQPHLNLQQQLQNTIDPDTSIWALEEDGHASTLLLELEKETEGFWPRLFSSDDVSQYIIVDDTVLPTAASVSTPTPTIPSPLANGHSQLEGNTTVEIENDDGDNDNLEQVVSGVVSDMMTRVAGNTVKNNNTNLSVVPNGHSTEHQQKKQHATTTIVEDANDDTENTDLSNIPNSKSAETITRVQPSTSASALKSHNANGNGIVFSRQTATRTNSKLTASSSTNGEQLEQSTEIEDVDEIEKKPSNNQAASSRSGIIAGPSVAEGTDIKALMQKYEDQIKKGGKEAGEAFLNLGTMYHYGVGFERNDGIAVKFMKKAFNQYGIVNAMSKFQLGLMYQQGGPGLERDEDEAVKWWQEAAELGSPTAMYNLGVMLINGTGCDMDPVLAMDWFDKAQQLDPKLKPPNLSPIQLQQRMYLAEQANKSRTKSRRKKLSPEEKEQRKKEAMETLTGLGYRSLALGALIVSVWGYRYWSRNTL